MGATKVIFDALYLVGRIEAVTAPRVRNSNPGAAELEVHSLAFLASVLHQWQGNGGWGYGFFATPDSEPFATDLSDALRQLKTGGMLADHGITNSLTSVGAGVLESLREAVADQSRVEALDAAIDATILLPMPLVVRALMREPMLRPKAVARSLLDESHLALIGDYLDAAADTVGSSAGLSAVAALLMNYLVVAGEESAA